MHVRNRLNEALHLFNQCRFRSIRVHCGYTIGTGLLTWPAFTLIQSFYLLCINQSVYNIINTCRHSNTKQGKYIHCISKHDNQTPELLKFIFYWKIVRRVYVIVYITSTVHQLNTWNKLYEEQKCYVQSNSLWKFHHVENEMWPVMCLTSCDLSDMCPVMCLNIISFLSITVGHS